MQIDDIRAERIRRLVEWHTTADKQRLARGIPPTKQALAAALGCNIKTLARDETMPEYTIALAAEQAKLAFRAGATQKSAAVTAAGDAADPDSLDVLVPNALARLVELSEGGDRDATKFLLSLPQYKDWMADQSRSSTLDYSAAADEQLVAELLRLAGEAAVAAALTAAGWTCTAPPPAEVAS